MFLRGEGRRITYEQWQVLITPRARWLTALRQVHHTRVPFDMQDLLKKSKLVGAWEVNQQSQITGDERCRNKLKAALSLPQVRFAFLNSQSADQLSAGVAKEMDAMLTLDYDELKECIARCGVDKYKSIQVMSMADATQGFLQNLIGEASEEEVIARNTVIRAARFRIEDSTALPGQSLAEHRAWLQVWQRMELQDLHQFPLWEKDVHCLLQKHSASLRSIFLAYARSIAGSDSAEDALEMEMGEFRTFVQDCGLETKEVSFDVMTSAFVKANATNTSEVHQQHRAERGTASRQPLVPGAADGKGCTGVKDSELVLHEFLNLLVRISFQRANPTFGNYGNKRELVPLPGCLEKMLEEDVCPRAKRETSAQFREATMQDPAVLSVITEYRDRLHEWYTRVTSDDTREAVISSKLGFQQWLRICDQQDLVGAWTVRQESDITGDPAGRDVEHRFTLSIPQVKLAFMDSQHQHPGRHGVAPASATDAMVELDFDEFVECVARCGIDKYGAVESMAPATAVKGMIRNVLGEANESEVVVTATGIKADGYDAPLPSELSPAQLTS